MTLCLWSIIFLLAQLTVWSVSRLATGPWVAVQLFGRALLDHGTAVGLTMAALSALGALIALRARRASPAGSGFVALLSAIGLGSAAWTFRLSQQGTAAAAAWAACLAASILVGLIWKPAVAAAGTLASASRGSGAGQQGLAPLSPAQWAVTILVLSASAALYGYRLMDVPGELNAFGTQAIVSAKRLRDGQLMLSDIILFREMTQEESGHSLLFVLWHTASQAVFGKLSVLSARIACASAVWLSIILMLRVARQLLGNSFGVLCMVVYACMPLTFFNARNEGIFGFSAFLLLACLDVLFSFMRRPTGVRTALLGASFPCIFYGLANIKLMYAAAASVLPLVAWKQGRWREWAKGLGLAALVAVPLLTPQFLHFSLVRRMMRGRGEHLFGGVLPHLAIIDPEKRGVWGNAKAILETNYGILSKGIIGPWQELPSVMPGLMGILVVVGAGLCVARLSRPDRYVALGVAAAGYFAPLIAIPLVWNRVLLLNIGQTLLIGVVWHELWQLSASSVLRRCARVALLSALAVFLGSAEPLTTAFFRQNLGVSAVRDDIILRADGRVVFVTDRVETALNFLRWNPPQLGRGSDARTPIVGIRESGVAATAQVIESLGISAAIYSNDKFPPQVSGSSKWRVEEGPSGMAVAWHDGPVTGGDVFVASLDPFTLNRSSEVFFGKFNYRSPYLFEGKIPSESLRLALALPYGVSKGAIFVRDGESYSPPVTVQLDQGASPLVEVASDPAARRMVWNAAPALQQGEHTISLAPQAGAESAFASEVVFVGTRAK